MTPEPSMLDAALALAARGLPVFPLQPRGKKPLTEHGFKDATTDPAQIREWWTKWPDANIGMPTGAVSGIDVLDVDAKTGGRKTIADLEADFGTVDTLTAETGGGGLHLWFTHVEGVRNRAGMLPGLDVRGDGGYVVVPPSIHPNGTAYRWLHDIGPEFAPVVPWPAWLLKIVLPAPRPASHAPGVQPTASGSGGTPYGLAALAAEEGRVAAAPEGKRNDVLNAAAYACGRLLARGELADEALVRARLAEAARRAGLESIETQATIESGMEAGKAKQRGASTRPEEGAVSDEAATDPSAAPGSYQGEEPAALPWRTLDEIERATKECVREFLWNEFLATRTVAILAGPPKEGKSEIAWAFASALTRGLEWLGHTAPKGYVVVLSEEGDHDILAKCDRYGIDRSRAIVLGRDVVMSAPDWTRLISDAVERTALFLVADPSAPVLLLIDSFGFWAGLEGDEERNEAATRDRVNSLQVARAAGLGVLVIHHPVKARDVEGIAALRGSGALAAGVESVGILRRASAGLGDCARRLEVFSRIAPCAAIVVERVIPEDVGEPLFRLVGAEASAPKGSAVADEKIVKALAGTGAFVLRSNMRELTGVPDRILDARLPALFQGGRIERTGTGARGSAFAYAAVGTPGPHLVAPEETPAAPAAPVETPATRRERAAAFLRAFLAPGPRAVQEVLAHGEDEGHAERTLRRAAGVLGVLTTAGRNGKPGTWGLPPAPAPSAPATATTLTSDAPPRKARKPRKRKTAKGSDAPPGEAKS